ncbi:MAG TPA: site-2 protease family protein [Candidatus Omnitrophota bacterium]|nr:site-2 protease family protein [Candidatus Omnitrophota bacterium]
MDGVAGMLLLIPPILFALTVHEFSHAYVASRMGDPTARLLGRLTLNPLAHLDPIGTILLLIAGFGWAKPVPVDARYLAHPRRDMMWIALAGPASNVILAALFGTLLRAVDGNAYLSGTIMGAALVDMVRYSVYLNLMLAVFNLIPIFPLDGSRILTGLLPAPAAERYRALEPIGPMLLLGLILIGNLTRISIIGMLILPVVAVLTRLFTGGLVG